MVEIIAEIAQGYEGKPVLAMLLVRAAIRANADAIKLQLVYADDSAIEKYPYYEFYKSLEMPFGVWKEIAEEVRRNGVKLYFDIGGERALKEAIDLRADGVKIHTTNFNNVPLVKKALAMFKKVFISFGGVEIDELKDFIAKHNIIPGNQTILMYGFQSEPTPVESNNLNRISALRKTFPGFDIGFMDHSNGTSDEGLTLALLALPFGICSIEKHITLDTLLKIEDYISALSPGDFKLFCKRVRHLECALGSENLELTEIEKEYRFKSMKVVISNKKLNKDTMLNSNDVTLKCVAYPHPPTSIHRVEDVIKHKLMVSVEPFEQITKDMIQ